MTRMVRMSGVICLVGDVAADYIRNHGGEVLDTKVMESDMQATWDKVCEAIRKRQDREVPTETKDPSRYANDTWRRQGKGRRPK